MFRKILKRAFQATFTPPVKPSVKGDAVSAQERRSGARPVSLPKVDENLLSDPNFKLVNSAHRHIGKRLEVYWGSQEFVSYVRNLLYDTRGDSRKGFPMAVLVALQKLSDEHEQAFPHIVPKDNLWPVTRKR